MRREEYLQRPLIEGVAYEIQEKRVRIHSPDTIFVEFSRVEEIAISTVEQAFRELKTAVIESGKIKLKGASKFLPAVRALYPEYSQAVARINSAFAEVADIARKIQVDGIHMGCVDDECLIRIAETKRVINPIFYRNSAYSKYLAYHNNVKRYLRERLWEAADLESCILSIA